ncbi:MAG: hypothetical protein HY530_03265 [Chloroflexi bacterium]|nr:hypothetical protein [Chloroflexota bacterium]
MSTKRLVLESVLLWFLAMIIAIVVKALTGIPTPLTWFVVFTIGFIIEYRKWRRSHGQAAKPRSKILDRILLWLTGIIVFLLIIFVVNLIIGS